jgi:ATP-dependent Lon protease
MSELDKTNKKNKNIVINIVKKKYEDDDDYTESDIDEKITSDQINNKRKKIQDSVPKRKRRNSESDIYYYKILERSKYDDYFKKQDKDKQIDILNKEDEVYNYFHSEVPIRYRILYSSLPLSTKSLIIQKIDVYENMKESDSEYGKLTKWFSGISKIPFDNYISMPVGLNDEEVRIQKFLFDSYEILRKTIYGQIEAKNKIMQVLAQWISNPNSNGQIIALEGPPGVGKTSLVKNGVSKALKRPFCFYALGGATDISNIEGHSYTYEGATWGRIVEMLMESKVMNPVIFFDELDKISDTTKGNEISSILTHMTDFSQNNSFSDKYFSGIDIDLSKAIFFFSFNDINLINPILKDRLTIVKFDGYSMEEKINIVRDFIVPDLLRNIGFQLMDINIDVDVIKYLINNYTNNELGVRNIKRCIEDLFLKINLLRLTKSDHNKNILDIDYNIENLSFPLNITNTIIDNLLKSKNKINSSRNMMYC